MGQSEPRLVDEVIAAADELDARRRQQIAIQIGIINRLMDGQGSQEIFQALTEENAALKAKVENLEKQIRLSQR